MASTPSGVVVGLLYLALAGADTRGFSHAPWNRRTVVSRLNAWATLGRAFFRAVVSILTVLTGFQVILYPGLDSLRIAHSGLYRVLDGLRLCLGLLDQVLELAQLPALHFQFVGTHTLYLLIYFSFCPCVLGFRRRVGLVYDEALR